LGAGFVIALGAGFAVALGAGLAIGFACLASGFADLAAGLGSCLVGWLVRVIWLLKRMQDQEDKNPGKDDK
jgi:hypothetical protein